MLPSEPWLEAHVPTGKLALDIGANVGDFTAHLADRFEQIIAFEPNPDAAQAFRIRHNSHIELREQAVGDSTGTLKLNLYGETAHTSAVVYEDKALNVFGRGEPTGSLRVPMVSVDSLELAPDFIKIDTEGFEREVLLGAKKTIRRHKPVILVEIHAIPHGDWCRLYLNDLGYRLEQVKHPNAGAGENNYWLVAS